jgi:hypothetical protein
MEIAQLTFSEIKSKTSKNYKDIGRFVGDNWENNFAGKVTIKKLAGKIKYKKIAGKGKK